MCRLNQFNRNSEMCLFVQEHTIHPHIITRTHTPHTHTHRTHTHRTHTHTHTPIYILDVDLKEKWYFIELEELDLDECCENAMNRARHIYMYIGKLVSS